jgi:signal transduction histidine kinase
MVQEQSQHLLLLCDTFIENQRSAFDDFLDESNRTLLAFQRMLLLSLMLLFALATALVVLVYRGMIAPLRHELTQSHAIIARQEKLASLGVLAAGVAHEIRNPLTAIKFRLFSLRKALSNVDGTIHEDAAVIGDEISRLERIVKDFLQFARPSEPTLISVPAERMMREVHDLLKPQLEKNSIELKFDAREPVWVRADTQQIKQVLINLIQNAADSIEQNGLITLRVHTGSRSSRKHDRSRVFLDVEDNGKGISSEAMERLFDPFFTTKEGGCGLGLPIAARIVEKHGGELRHKSGSPRGTVFSVVLPRVNEHEA